MYDAVMDRITRLVPQRFEGYNPRLCRGCEIDGVHVECSFSIRVPGGKATSFGNTRCLFCSETRLKTYVYDDSPPMTKAARCGVILRLLRAYCAGREEHPAVYDAAMDRITRWVPDLKGTLERVAAKVYKPPANQVRPPISLVSSRLGSIL